MATQPTQDWRPPAADAGGEIQSPEGGDWKPPEADGGLSATLGEKASAVGEGMVGGAVRSIGVVPGVVGGAAIGTAVAPFLGPFAPAAPVLGGLAGGAYGMWAGDTAASGLGLREPKEMRQEVRKYGVLGESFGGSVGALGMPYGAALTGWRAGASEAGKLLNRMIESAKAAPLKFGLTEVSMAGSAATAP